MPAVISRSEDYLKEKRKRKKEKKEKKTRRVCVCVCGGGGGGFGGGNCFCFLIFSPSISFPCQRTIMPAVISRSVNYRRKGKKRRKKSIQKGGGGGGILFCFDFHLPFLRDCYCFDVTC